MRLGLSIPVFDELADPQLLSAMAASAEAAGWDGFFLWDHICYRHPVSAAIDPWIALAAVAVNTRRITIGPMVTPLARRRPQVVARQLVTLDHLAEGRLILGAGLGSDSSAELSRFGEELDDRRRADMLDEALDVLTALLRGEEVDHHGVHYTVRHVTFLPPPHRGMVPIWIAARWPHRRPIRRAARYDGLFVIDLTPDELPQAIDYVKGHRPEGGGDFDIIVDAPGGSDPRPWADAGATWCLLTFDPFTVTASEVRTVIEAGPPPL